MTAFLPINLLSLFAPREPLPYLPPTDQRPWEKKPWPYTGIAQYLDDFEDPKETPPATRGETRDERRVRKRKEREERYSAKLETAIESWDPSNDSKISGDPFKTLFVGRINFDTSEGKLRREFEAYGPVKHINVIMDEKNEKPRGYAFIEYENERDMHSAYKYADGKKIDGKRVVVDVERGRTVKSWKPRRLGGGLGGTRKGAPNECIKYSGRVDERDMERERERERDRERDRNHDDRDKRKDRGRSDRERSDRERGDRERGGGGGDRRRRSRSRDRDRDKDRRKGRSRSRDRERDRERKERSRSRDRSDRKDKKKERDRDRDRKGKDRSDRKDKDRDRESSRRDRSDKHEEKMEPQDSNGVGNHDDGHVSKEAAAEIGIKEEPMES